MSIHLSEDIMSSCFLLFLSLSFSFSFSFSFLSINKFSAEAAPEYLCHSCPNTSLFATDSAYRSKLNALWFQKRKLHAVVSSLSSDAAHSLDGFANATTGRNPPHRAYGFFLCRGDLDTATCSRCVAIAKRSILERCPHQPVSAIWFDQCMLRYSNRAIFSAMEPSPNRVLHNNRSVTDPTRFMRLLGETLNHIAARASAGGPGKKVAAAEANFTRSQKLHALGQCTPYLTASDCFRCLQFGIANLSQGKEGGRFVAPSCNLRYELYSFYDASALPSPTYPAPPPTLPAPITGTKAQSNKLIAIVILVAVVSLGLLCLLCNCCCRWMNASQDTGPSEISAQVAETDGEAKVLTLGTGTETRISTLGTKTDGDEDQFVTAPSIFENELTFEAIKDATDDFSGGNKLGSGGFGDVFKGKLRNGQLIAVKKLSPGVTQGEEEFKNEVVSLGNIQHQNLVKLLGSCSEGQERLLVYEFAENRSLDQILFDPERSKELVWPTRYQIICGIAQGMRYLHDKSQPRIIHRDLKPGNILLDIEMIPKISDFGLARIFGDNRSWEITRKIAGTPGYVAPEYYLTGNFSPKSDVYSFGVLLLQLVSGKKIPYSDDVDIISCARGKLEARTPLEMLDATAANYTEAQVVRCLEIGVQCAQQDPNSRPTMEEIVNQLEQPPQ